MAGGMPSCLCPRVEGSRSAIGKIVPYSAAVSSIHTDGRANGTHANRKNLQTWALGLSDHVLQIQRLREN